MSHRSAAQEKRDTEEKRVVHGLLLGLITRMQKAEKMRRLTARSEDTIVQVVQGSEVET